ncbi:MAG: EamA family transporter [Verrucomicrobiota bacterium]
MWKLLLILLVGLFFESVGVVCLKKGITEMGAINGFGLNEIVRVVKSGITNKHILLGVMFEALFFGCLLLLMSRADVSFVWPLTALSFVFTTFAAMWFLHEKVSTTRWIGVVLILIGAGLVSWSEKQKEKAEISTAAPINQETQP